MKIKVKFFNEELKTLEFIEGDKSNWIDLRAAVDINLSKFEYKLIPLGIAMELPTGYEAIVAPRSSTFKNFGIIMANSIGIIDNSYCGDNDQWHFPALAMKDTIIKTGDRICQFRIIKSMTTDNDIEFEKVETLGNIDRGGIGSTGIN